ncbi:MAG: winged helix-turn-helix domain-containing protein [Nanoarchaeota archaeon]|nr:winged helix-turn-helix domain-containing protein [Nanoarchaeota archaeon]
MEEKILIDKKTLKAIAVDSRMNILRLLKQKKYTLTDISELLDLRNSTVKEHLDILVKADLIKKEVTDRKWKYYSLSFKGRRLIEPKEIKVMFAFAATLIGAFAVAIAFIGKLGLFAKSAMESDTAVFAARAMTDMVEEESMAAGSMAAKAAPPPMPIEQISPYCQYQPEIQLALIFFILVIISAFLLGYLLKKRPLIISKGGKK